MIASRTEQGGVRLGISKDMEKDGHSPSPDSDHK